MEQTKKDHLLDDIDQVKEVHLLDYLTLIRKRKWILIACILVSLATAIIVNQTIVPIYKANCQIMIDKDTNKSLVTGENMEYLYYETALSEELSFNTQLKIITSYEVLEQVIGKLGIQDREKLKKADESMENAGFASNFRTSIRKNIKDIEESIKSIKEFFTGPEGEKGTEAKAVPKGLAKGLIDDLPDKEMAALVSSLTAKIEVQPIKDTRLVDITVNDEDPIWAAAIANGVVKGYIDYDTSIRYKSVSEFVDWISAQISEMRQKIDAAEKKFFDFKTNNKIYSLPERKNVVTGKVSELNDAYIKLHTERMGIKAKVLELKNLLNRREDRMLGNDLIDDPLLVDIRKELSKENIRLDDLKRDYKDKHPEVLDAASKIEILKKEFSDTLGNSLKGLLLQDDVLKSRVDTITSDIAELEEGAIADNKLEAAYLMLEREVETNKVLYDVMLNKLKETKINETMKKSNIRLTEPAVIPGTPSGSQKKVNIVLGFLLGMMGGLGLIFSLEYFETGIKTEDDVKHYLQLPILGIIPEDDESSKSGKSGKAGKSHKASKTAKAGNTGNTGNTGMAGITAKVANTGMTDSAGNTGMTDSAGNTGMMDSADKMDNSGKTGTIDNTGNTGLSMMDGAGNAGIGMMERAGNAGIGMMERAGNTGIGMMDRAGNAGMSMMERAGKTGIGMMDRAGNTGTMDNAGKTGTPDNTAKDSRHRKSAKSAFPLVTHEHSSAAFSEAFRSLRTNLTYSLGNGSPSKCILVTSSIPQEGKTTTASNLALTLAQAGERVLLIDTDLRVPSIHKRFNLDHKSKGLTNILVDLFNTSLNEGTLQEYSLGDIISLIDIQGRSGTLTISDHSVSDHLVSDHSVSDHLVSDHSVSDHSVSDHLVSDHSVSNRSVSDHSDSDHSDSDHWVSDHLVSDRSVSDHSEIFQLFFKDGELIDAQTKDRPERKRLGALLVASQRITEEQRKNALLEQDYYHERLGSILLNMNLVTPEDLRGPLTLHFSSTMNRILTLKEGYFSFKDGCPQCTDTSDYIKDKFSSWQKAFNMQAASFLERNIFSSLQSGPLESMKILTCGPLPSNPSELLSSRRMKALMHILRGKFDYIVMDSPPINSVTDASILSSLADGVIQVIYVGHANRKAVIKAKEQLDSIGAKIFGVVMNRLNLKKDGYYYYSYYRYYQYGHYGGTQKEGSKSDRNSDGDSGRNSDRNSAASERHMVG